MWISNERKYFNSAIFEKKKNQRVKQRLMWEDKFWSRNEIEVNKDIIKYNISELWFVENRNWLKTLQKDYI